MLPGPHDVPHDSPILVKSLVQVDDRLVQVGGRRFPRRDVVSGPMVLAPKEALAPRPGFEIASEVMCASAAPSPGRVLVHCGREDHCPLLPQRLLQYCVKREEREAQSAAPLPVVNHKIPSCPAVRRMLQQPVCSKHSVCARLREPWAGAIARSTERLSRGSIVRHGQRE